METRQKGKCLLRTYNLGGEEDILYLSLNPDISSPVTIIGQRNDIFYTFNISADEMCFGV